MLNAIDREVSKNRVSIMMKDNDTDDIARRGQQTPNYAIDHVLNIQSHLAIPPLYALV